ncbi:lysoplasmalogenase [Winogradskyella poriferorum]|uniref:lysoplasmalogenase n=1 Tax=Winogradskyella poriferorum TaxID=307627 RepID=UPI003D662A7C
MLTTVEKQFSILFFIIVLLEIITGLVPDLSYAHYIAKPAIVTSLIILFYNNANNLPSKIKRLTLFALAFSVIGDILLMFVDFSEHYFMFGLVAFLLAHVMYIFCFLNNKAKTKGTYWFILLLVAYAVGLFILLKDGLGDLLLPVVFYILVILTMTVSAYIRKKNISEISYLLVLIGALCFMISDSILAINKFYKAIPYSGIYIMTTYALAQYLIVLGILKINVTNTKV